MTEEEKKHFGVVITDLALEAAHLRAVNAELSEKVRQLTDLLDDKFGTPCQQIRDAEEKTDS